MVTPAEVEPENSVIPPWRLNVDAPTRTRGACRLVRRLRVFPRMEEICREPAGLLIAVLTAVEPRASV
jgi:hypothetical protein